MKIKKDTQHVSFVDLAAQYETISEQISGALSKVLRATDFILGKDVGFFEEEFAAFCETDYGVGVDSGTSALELALRACGVGPGDEVITAANTFVATAFAISYTGATPVLVDIDPDTYSIDIKQMEEAISIRTKAVIPVHLYGHPAEMDSILDISQRHGLMVIEDACQAHGAKYKGKRVGSLGHAGAFSFYPAKNLGAYGDGGIVVTSDKQVAESIRMLRNYGQREKYNHQLQGYNRRLDTLQAAILRVKLKHLDAWNDSRRQHAELYNRLLVDSEVTIPREAAYAESVWHVYVIRASERNALMAHLAERGIATGIHYPFPVHLLPAYGDLGYKRGDFPVAEGYAEQILSLPMFAELRPDSIEYVAEAVRDFVLESKAEPLLARAGD